MQNKLVLAKENKMDRSGLAGQIIDEITACTGWERPVVRDQVLREMKQPGSTQIQEALEQGLDFHVYNSAMDRFYKTAKSFIFVLSVDFYSKERQTLIGRVKERLQQYLKKMPDDYKIKILMFGDGIGGDTLFLHSFFKERACFYYFDVPGSETFRYALKRFQLHGVSVKILTDYSQIPSGAFDALISLEVLEHLPDPLTAIGDFRRFLRMDGIAIVSECFQGVCDQYPTHLRSNLKYAGKTPFLFLKKGLMLDYYARQWPLLFKPMEFVKREAVTALDWIRLSTDPCVIALFCRWWVVSRRSVS